MRQRIGWILLFAVVLVVLGRFALAQGPSQRGVPTSPLMISGPDLRFVVEGRKTAGVTGHFEVHLNGNWEPLASGMRAQPLSLR